MVRKRSRVVGGVWQEHTVGESDDTLQDDEDMVYGQVRRRRGR